MAQDITTLAALYKGWETYQRHLIQAITPLTAEQLAHSMTPNTHTVGQIAAHIAFGRATWMHRVMGIKGPELEKLAQRNWEAPEYTTKVAELVQALEVTWRELHNCLERWTLHDIESVFKIEHLGKPYEFSLRWIIWHLIEHDMHHGGELSFLLGAQGLTAVDLDQIAQVNH